VTASRKPPILVTGLPRSGTTWLARELATARNTSLPGREPMNPRHGQFALGGSLSGWARLGPNPGDRQRRTLGRVYQGLEPRTYGRYGVRAWAAPLPWVRVIIKDPFALLSLPAVTEVTGARAVVLFRHPAALLASYRRMGWQPDVQEIRDLGLLSPLGEPDAGSTNDDVAAMGWFWAACYAAVLQDVASLPGVLVADHATLVHGGAEALRSLAGRLDLHGLHGAPATHHVSTHAADHSGAHAAPQLHRFDRTPAEVAEGWRRDVGPDEVRRIEELTAPVLHELTARSVRFRVGDATGSEVTP